MVGRVLDGFGCSGPVRHGVLAVATIGATATCSPAPTVQELEVDLASVSDRVLLARLSGPYAHAPCAPTVDTTFIDGLTCDGTGSARENLGPLGSRILELTQRSPGGRSTRLMAHWTLLASTDPQDYDQIERELERVAVDGDSGGDYWSDIAAVRLALADLTDEPRLVLDAVTAADRALAVEPGKPEALFNRALSLEWLQLKPAAVAAWEAFVASETDGPWAAEGRRRLASLEAPRPTWAGEVVGLPDVLRARDVEAVARLATTFASDLEAYVVEELLTEWATAIRAGRAALAAELWTDAELVAGTLPTGRGSLSETIVRISASSGAARAAYVDGLADLGLGISAHDADPALASELYRDATIELRSVDSPLSSYPAERRAGMEFRRQRDDEVLAIADEMLLSADSTGDDRGRALGWRWRAVIAGVRASYSDAREATSMVVRWSGPQDYELRARAYSDLASNAATLRGPDEAWRPTLEALRNLRRHEAPAALNSVLRRASDLLSQVGHDDLALAAWDEVVSLARRRNDPSYLVSTLRHRAQLLLATGRFEEARSSVDEALELVPAFGDELRERAATTGLRLVQAEVEALSDPRSAIERLTMVVADLRRSESAFDLVRAHLALAQAHLSEDNAERAAARLDDAVSEIDRQRNTLSRDDRTGFQDRSRTVVEQLVALHLSNDDVERAFEDFERMRARVLLEDLSDVQSAELAGDAPIDVQALRRALPDGVALLSYAVLPEATHRWIVTRDTVHISALRATRDQIRHAVESFRSAVLRAEDDRVRSSGADLHRLLLDGVEPLGPLPERLVIVPDGALHHLPFVALTNPATGRFVVEEHEIQVTPSASIFVRASARSGALLQARHPRVLAVGNPRFPAAEYSWPDLPGAALEARSVRSEWARSKLLVGRDATVPAFLEEAAVSEIVHFAGHAIVRPDSPSDSYLLFAAGDAQRSPELRIRDLMGMSLPATGLVILSACETAGGDRSDTEGVASLARGFLAAGVPQLISSLWAVPDQDTARFFAEFHGDLVESLDAPATLREVQRRYATGAEETGVPVSSWAAFQFIGGR